MFIAKVGFVLKKMKTEYAKYRFEIGLYYFSLSFGTVACACLDTSRARQLAPKTRYARFGEPRKLAETSTRPRRKQTKKKNPKPSGRGVAR